MASKEPMPRYFFSRMPSEKKYSPGASLVAASREPIITGTTVGQSVYLHSHRLLNRSGDPTVSGRTCGGSQRQGLGDVAHGLDATVGGDRHAEPPGVLGHFVDCRRLGSATRQHCWRRTRRSRMSSVNIRVSGMFVNKAATF